jgi:uncharacterized membrane protein
MKQRFEIKALAKEGFKEQRGAGILIFLVFTAIAIVGSLFSFIPILGSIISLAVSFVLIPVLGVGLSWGYLKIYRKEQTEIGVLFSKFNNDFGRSLGGTLWMMLFLFLWSLIAIIGGIIVMAITLGAAFITVFANPATLPDLLLPMVSSFIISLVVMILLSIPAIIKYYAYSLTAYVLADCPNVKATDAIKISMKMTKGHKGKLFVLDLSFIGWSLLSCITLFILAFVFVMPYYTTTWSGFYEELKAQALESGAITAEELA